MATIAAETGATITLAAAISRVTAAVQCAITSTLAADQHPTVLIRVLAADSPVILDGCRLSVDKVANVLPEKKKR